MISTFEKIIAYILLLFAVCFNLWLYWAEPTAHVDPNDNAFQYALVARTNEIWAYADKTCPKNLSFVICHLSLLIDHWVPNWSEGYNLPYYYSHMPQIMIVGSYRLSEPVTRYALRVYNNFNPSPVTRNSITLFEYYHWTIYLLLCLFPLSIFLSLKILKQPWLTAGIGAFLSIFLSTDGLYGLDPSSFLWRGWGLSSQLFSAVFLPLALASIIRVTSDELRVTSFSTLTRHPETRNVITSYILAILFITLTTMGHLGMGMMLFLAIPVVTFTKPILTLCKNSSTPLASSWVEELKHACIQTMLLAIPPLLLLSYWILPTILNSQYHNISFWDPLWKFNSYGINEILTNLFNGNLFDFGRLPIITGFVGIGLFYCLLQKNGQETINSKQKPETRNLPRLAETLYQREVGQELSPLPFLFLFFLFLYFGRTTWGNILNIIPGMDEFHQHRFIVGVHLIGLFLAPIGLMWIVNNVMSYVLRVAGYIQKKIPHTTLLFLCLYAFMPLCLFFLLSPQTMRYGTYNETLINKANTKFVTEKHDADLLISELKKLPSGRIFAGRGGTWGKNFRVAETPYYMYLSTYGFPTVLWLPETWSLNADTEQYFSEDNQSHYELYNIRYVVAPVNQPSQKFWTLLSESTTWKLYEVTGQKTINLPAGRQGNKQNTKNQEPGTTNYITVGTSPAVVFSDKQSFTNVVRLWIQSPYPEKGIFPELRLNKKLASQGQALRSYFLPCNNLPCFSMTDEATFQTFDGKTHALFAEPPKYMTPWEWPSAFAQCQISNAKCQIKNMNSNNQFPISQQLISISSQSSNTDMVFTATIEVQESCPTCVVILKQTYHPNWKATVNGKQVTPIQVFPAFSAVRLEEPGTYTIVFSYQPSFQKQLLFILAILTLGVGIYIFCKLPLPHFLRHINTRRW